MTTPMFMVLRMHYLNFPLNLIGETLVNVFLDVTRRERLASAELPRNVLEPIRTKLFRLSMMCLLVTSQKSSSEEKHRINETPCETLLPNYSVLINTPMKIGWSIWIMPSLAKNLNLRTVFNHPVASTNLYILI